MRLLNPIFALPMWQHAALAAASFGAFQWIKTILDASYAASRHPVDYATGQTSFNSEAIKGYYAQMIETGTLDIYYRTQLIDFAFILCMIALALFFVTFVTRLSRPDSWARKIGQLASIAVICGALCDTMENLVSFVMLANPTSFANWMALPYSGFASIKFALITTGMLCLIICVALCLIGRLIRRPTLG